MRRLRAGLALVLLLAASPVLANYETGRDARDIGDYPTAFSEFARAAAQGDMRAANALGELYERGDGVEADPVRAAQWYRRAADAGNREAQYNLAGMYRSGDGVPLDAEQSMAWYQRAAEQGLAIAQFFVAKNHEHGQGVPQDLVEAWAWYALAAEAGDGGSAANRDRVAGFLDAGQRGRARTLLHRHARALGLSPERMTALGMSAGDEPSPAGELDTPRELVAAVQQALVELGYDVGDVDGVIGSRTRSAIADFARGVGMERTPEVGVELLTRLQATLAARDEAGNALAVELPRVAAAELDPAGSEDETVPMVAAETAETGADGSPSSPDETPVDTVATSAASLQDALVAEAETLLESLGHGRVRGEREVAAALGDFASDAGLAAPPPLSAPLLTRMRALAAQVEAAPRERELLRAIQAELDAQGHAPGPVDGLMGSRTRGALDAWAEQAGLVRVPSVSPLLLALLREGAPDAEVLVDDTVVAVVDQVQQPPRIPDPEARALDDALAAAAGDDAPDGKPKVSAVQAALEWLGLEPGPVDGLDGSQTRSAIRAFREQRGLPGEDTLDESLLAQLRAALQPAANAAEASSSAASERGEPAAQTARTSPERTPLAGPAEGAGVTSGSPGQGGVAVTTPQVADEPAPDATATRVADTNPVRAAQRLLGELGFDAGPVDGIAGTRTRNAVLAFERANGFDGDGRITPALVQRLRAALDDRSAANAALASEVLRRLLVRGYTPGTVEDVLDETARDALREFQRDQSLPVTGEPDLPTLARLRDEPERPPVTTALVRDLQSALAERGYDPGPADGAAGPRTRAAIAAFRSDEGLPAAESIDIALLRRLQLL